MWSVALITPKSQIELGGPDVVATAENQDAYAALDELSQRLDQLLERRHDRRKDNRNHPHPVELETSLPKADSTRSAKAS
jgi:putative sigma-54 modulation protein